MPVWLSERGRTTHYFAMWVAAMLEETLWAHFIYHCVVLNYRAPLPSMHIRKNDLANLFESRTDNTAL
jgi:hypothetical protein